MQKAYTDKVVVRLLTDWYGGCRLDLIRKNCSSLKEQSGGELVTTVGILCTHWLAAAIKNRYRT
jgi:hypothetical protein